MTKRTVLLLGAGKIGSLITCMLAESGDYDVHVGSLNTEAAQSLCRETGLCDVNAFLLDVTDEKALSIVMQSHPYEAVISCLPYYCNPLVADLAARYGIHYFDLTEDVEVTRHVQQISAHSQTIFMPQCEIGRASCRERV